ncbi:MAG: HEAT repeat domain-containing protein [Verrucomicrobia bacterium]|nr:HEAT repeat domain-containing protein [Verrucomicrobiota bacterium]
MKRNYQIGLFLLAAVIAITLGVFWKLSSEPTYGGRILSAWLADLDPKLPEQTRAGATNAIRAFGIKALPRMVADLQAEYPFLKQILIDLNDMPGSSSLIEEAYEKRSRAARAFYILGAEAKSAIPELTVLMQKDNGYVSSALAGIGPDALSTMTNALLSPTPHVAGNAAKAIQIALFRKTIQRSDVVATVPVLARNLKDSNPHTRRYAAAALGEIRTDPFTFVPALENLLGDTNAGVRAQAANALRKFGENALPVIPALSNALNDPDPAVRERVEKALLEIKKSEPKTN